MSFSEKLSLLEIVKGWLNTIESLLKFYRLLGFRNSFVTINNKTFD